MSKTLKTLEYLTNKTHPINYDEMITQSQLLRNTIRIQNQMLLMQKELVKGFSEILEFEGVKGEKGDKGDTPDISFRLTDDGDLIYTIK